MTPARIREAAEKLRETPVHESCECARPDTWFSRVVCPEPCGSMHDYCSKCNRVVGTCPHLASEPSLYDFCVSKLLDDLAHQWEVNFPAGTWDDGTARKRYRNLIPLVEVILAAGGPR